MELNSRMDYKNLEETDCTLRKEKQNKPPSEHDRRKGSRNNKTRMELKNDDL